MNLGFDLFGNSSENSKEYVDVSFDDDLNVYEGESEQSVYRATIKTNSDMLNAEDKLYDGNIVIANISDVNDGMKTERVIHSLRETAEQLCGDIAFLNDDENYLIITPSSTSVCKSEI